LLDSAVAIFDGVAGVAAVWRQGNKYQTFLNKIVQIIIDLLVSVPAVLQLRIGTKSNFLGANVLVTIEAVVWRKYRVRN